MKNIFIYDIWYSCDGLTIRINESKYGIISDMHSNSCYSLFFFFFQTLRHEELLYSCVDATNIYLSFCRNECAAGG